MSTMVDVEFELWLIRADKFQDTTNAAKKNQECAQTEPKGCSIFCMFDNILL